MSGAIIYIAPIITMDPAQPTAEAFAVEGERIVAVGSLEFVRAEMTDAAREVFLDGTVLPGLIDAAMRELREFLA